MKGNWENNVSTNGEQQLRDRNYRKELKDTCEVKSKNTEMKNSSEWLIENLSREKKELLNMKTGNKNYLV